SFGNIKILEIPMLLKTGIIEFFKYFFESTKKYLGTVSAIMNLVVFISIGLLSLNILVRNKLISNINKLLLLVLIIIHPLIFSLIYLLGPVFIHQIMIISFICVYYMAIILMEYTIRNKIYQKVTIINNMTVIAIFLVSISWGIFANKCYIAFDVKNNNMYSFANRIVNKIDDFEDFNYLEEEAIIIGNRVHANFGASKFEEFSSLSGITGIDMPRDFNFMGESLTYREYLRNMLGVNLIYPGKDKEEEIKLSQDFIEMPDFPKEGCIKKIDGILVVKISEYKAYGE
ncbi:hypothetical protein LJC13_01240, partial [Peptostreptococcaceae bacterium OttesenSCG-928-C18]|nr:hypothetical protein [Peptostreptococcaceae bacterium OttesenSCG-928-C18]